MIYFHNDYNAMCHPAVLERMNMLSDTTFPGYGTDRCCRHAADLIRCRCQAPDAAVHFLVGGTQTNMTVIAAALRPHQCVIAANTGHINVHETGAIEATGHKVLALPSDDGKLTAAQVDTAIREQRESGDAEHIAQPKMVYISDSTEVGTVYTLRELKELSAVCRKWGIYLFLDGARLSYALTVTGGDVTLADLARLCDVFYIGGTKCGAMMGEAVVITNPAIGEDFRYLIKQRGGMLAKGWLLGIQFEALLEDDLYFEIARRANLQADRLRAALADYPVMAESNSNQLFPILSDTLLDKLSKDFTFSEMGRVDETHRAVRFCTSWATEEEEVDALISSLKRHKNS